MSLDYPYMREVHFNPSKSLLAGLPTSTLQTWLVTAQTALMQLMTGAKVVEASYTQGDGTKMVKYQASNQQQLSEFILLLQAQLGIVRRPRRPVQFFTT